MNFKNKKLVSITFTCFLPTLVCAADISNSLPWAGFYAGVNAGYAWDKSNIGVVGNMIMMTLLIEYLCYNIAKGTRFCSPISPYDMGAILGASNKKYLM